MSLWQKVVAGGPNHKSRLHTEKGQRIDLSGLIYLPAAAASFAMRVVAGYRPRVPWLGYRAVKRLDKLIRPDWSMAEFGSGMSTVWFARRAARVVSLEDNAAWHQAVQKILADHKLANVDYRYRPTDQYPGTADLPAGSLDFALIDGSRRADCAAEAVRLVKPGGYVYLDNSDKDATDPRGDVRRAENTLLAAAVGGTVEYFVDLVPTYLAVTEGLLVRLPAGK